MYEEFFGLQRRPFSATPDATYFVPLEGPQAALDALAVSCERGQGISVLTGETGVGKTLVGLRLAFELQPTFATAFLNHSAFPTRRALLQAVLFELNRPYNRMAEQELRLELMAALKTLVPQHQALVVILDEAHRLSLPVLDEVRMLTMLADNGIPLIRVVLIGNRDLEERLADPELSEFNQRICCQVDLEPLTQAESIDYLRMSVDIAGAHPDDLFASDALPFIAKAADGNPRCLNHLADHSLLLAFVSEQRPVTADVVRDALNDLKQLPLHWNDPVGGSEVYRGMSHQPVMEDSAVNLWPQTEQCSEETGHAEAEEAVESAHDSWETESLGHETSAIEIGGDSATFESSHTEGSHPESDNGKSTSDISCLKDDWHVTTPRAMSLDDVLADVAELTEQVEFERELSAADTLSGSPHFGQIFDAHKLEFGAPSSESFAVDEFANHEDNHEDEESMSATDEYLTSDEVFDADCNESHVASIHRFEQRDEDKTNSFDLEEAQPQVWNLPARSWESDDSPEFEEEPVVDRYVRIESGANNTGIVWNFNAPHNHQAAKRAPATAAITVLREVVATSFDEAREQHECEFDEREQQHSAMDSADDFSGIVESYARPTCERNEDRTTFSLSPRDLPNEDFAASEPTIQRHLPTQLLQATYEDDGLEEQLATDVLDLYLETQQMLNRVGRTAVPTISLDEPELEDTAQIFDVVKPEPIHNEIPRGDSIRDESRPTGPDVIQRAYGRLFSELRRKKR